MGYKFTITHGLRTLDCIKSSNVDSGPMVKYCGKQNDYHSLPIKNYIRNHGGKGGSRGQIKFFKI